MPVCLSLSVLHGKKKVEGLDKLVDLLTLWTERLQETERRGKLELKVSRDAVRTLIQYLGMILKVDRSKGGSSSSQQCLRLQPRHEEEEHWLANSNSN
jgi:hypothetical protein